VLGVDDEPEVELGAADDVDVVVLSLFLLSLALLELDSLDELSFFAPPPLLYRSAYQPPPFRMKPAPPDTWRFAVACLQFGHSVRGAALMDCSASQAWPQAVQAYS
jgi:hypothetical protein